MNQLALIAPDPPGEIVTRLVELPFAAISKNVWDKWQSMWQAGTRNKWRRALAEGFERQQFPKGMRHVSVHARLVFGSRGRRDWQNYVHPMWYFVADALVAYGCIPDDTPGFFSCGPNGGIEFAVDTRRYVQPKQRRRVILGFAFEA